MRLPSIAFVALSLAALTAGCGSEFQAGSSASTSGSGAGGGGTGGGVGNGGSGGAGQGGGGTGGGAGGGAPACAAGTAPGAIRLWTTLDSAFSIQQPKIGSGESASFVTTPENDFVPALSGAGVRIDVPGEHVRFRQVVNGNPNFNSHRGTIDFCYRPAYNHDDGLDHTLFGALLSVGFFHVRKAALNNNNALQIITHDGVTGPNQTVIPPGAYALEADTWHRVTISWDFAVMPGVQQVRVYIDAKEVAAENPPTGPYMIPVPSIDDFFYIGAWGASGVDPPWSADGVIDEFVIYGEPIVP